MLTPEGKSILVTGGASGIGEAACLLAAKQGARVTIADPLMGDWAAQVHPYKRLGLPEEVAAAALWLLSDAASLVTGISMSDDGGYSMV